MKRILLFITSLISLQPLLAKGFDVKENMATPVVEVLKGELSGKITNAVTGKPIAYVTILLSDLKLGTTSNALGEYSIKNITSGSHLIEVSHIGYATIAENIEIFGDIKKDFLLIESVVEKNAVVVTGISGATALKKIPFDIFTLRKQDLFAGAASNIIDALSKVGGVTTLSTGPAISKPVIRGLGYNRVLTINDGTRQEGQQWGDEHGIEIDEASVSKIEILKGPASIIYGSDALAGVINIITNVPLPLNTVAGNINTNIQSNNKLRSINANIGGNQNGFNWNIYTSNKAASDYKNKFDGKVFNSKFVEKNMGGYIGYNASWGYSHILCSNFNLRTGLITGERNADGFFTRSNLAGNTSIVSETDFNSINPKIPYQNINHFKIATDNSIKLGKNKMGINIAYQQNRRKEFGNADDIDEQSLFFDLQTITYTAQYHLLQKKGWKTSFGINGMLQKNLNKGIEQLVPNYNLFDIGSFLYLQKIIKKFTLSGGIRYDERNIDVKNLLDSTAIKNIGFKKTFTNFSGSVGMALQLSNTLNVKLNIAKGFRAPSIAELASNGTHPGTLRYEYGTSNLKSETSFQTDAVVDFSTEHLSLSIAAFYNNFNNFIFFRKLQNVAGSDSTITIDGDDLKTYQFNQQKVILSGVEFTIDFHPHPLDWLHIQNTFSLVNGQFKTNIENNKNLPFVPAARSITEFKANFNKVKNTFQNFYITIQMDNTFAQKNVFTVYNTETATNGYSLLNASIGTDITNKKQATICSINFSGNNLTNLSYQNHLSRLKYTEENIATGRRGVFNQGRNFSLKINIPINFSSKIH
jgi:iron complex outermembrane recepter protein